jgi:hypothetical protein
MVSPQTAQIKMNQPKDRLAGQVLFALRHGTPPTYATYPTSRMKIEAG